MSSPRSAPPTGPSDGELELRARRESDFEAVRAAQHDVETRRWLEDAPLDPDSPAASVARALAAWESGERTPFVVADARSQEPLGLANLRLVDDAALVAISVFPASRGRGVATGAVRLLVGWAFDALDVAEVRYEVDRRNAGSVAVAEAVGLRRRGERPGADDADERGSTLVYGVTRAQWREDG